VDDVRDPIKVVRPDLAKTRTNNLEDVQGRLRKQAKQWRGEEKEE